MMMERLLKLNLLLQEMFQIYKLKPKSGLGVMLISEIMILWFFKKVLLD